MKHFDKNLVFITIIFICVLGFIAAEFMLGKLGHFEKNVYTAAGLISGFAVGAGIYIFGWLDYRKSTVTDKDLHDINQRIAALKKNEELAPFLSSYEQAAEIYREKLEGKKFRVTKLLKYSVGWLLIAVIAMLAGAFGKLPQHESSLTLQLSWKIWAILIGSGLFGGFISFCKKGTLEAVYHGALCGLGFGFIAAYLISGNSLTDIVKDFAGELANDKAENAVVGFFNRILSWFL